MWAIEPLAELPVGAMMAVPNSALAKFINGNDISVTFTAGVRFWLLWDWFSLDIHLSKPLYPSDKTIRLSSTGAEYDASSVRRVVPGLGIGLVGDVLWLGVDYDQLRHRPVVDGALDPFKPNDVITGAVVFTVAIAPVAAFRNGIGALKSREKATASSTAAPTPSAAAATPPSAPTPAPAASASTGSAATAAAASKSPSVKLPTSPPP